MFFLNLLKVVLLIPYIFGAGITLFFFALLGFV